MGINNGHKTLYGIKDITMNQLFAIAKQRSIELYAGNSAPTVPTLDIDASWLVRSKTSVKPKGKVNYLMKVSTCFMKAGFNVVIVCDGSERHHSKRATVARVADSYRCRTTLLKYKNRILHLFDVARDEGRSNTDAEKLELKKMSDTMQSLNNKINSTLYDTGDVFFKAILERIEIIKINNEKEKDKVVGPGNIQVIQAEQQADSCIAARANRYITSVILTADSDLAVLLGSKCLSIKCYHYNNNKNEINQLDIFCATKIGIYQIAKYINLPLILKKNYVPAIFNLFDYTDHDYRVRGLIAVGIGCDVYPSGVKGIGPQTLLKFVKKLKDDKIDLSSYYNAILKFYGESVFKIKARHRYDNLTREDESVKVFEFENMINCFVESYLYEPANFFFNLEKNNQQHSTYIFDKPSKLHLYNKAFIRSDLVDCCDVWGGVDCCVGPGTGEHMFIPAEGSFNCLSCDRVICYCCLFHKPKDDRKFCVDCYLSESNVTKQDLDNLPTEQEMLDVCAEYGCPINQTDDLAERINLYQNIILNKKILDTNTFTTLIPMPEQSTTYLSNLDTVIEVSLKHGGSFINNEELPLQNLVEVLEIFKALIEVDEGQEQSLQLTSNAITPKLVQFFAEQSRIHFGWRLLSRGLRHSIDLMKTDVTDTYMKIFRYKNTTGIHLKMKVKASMRKLEYDTEVAFTINQVVACKCSCSCGSNNLQRTLCVHILPCLELLGFFLKQSLAEHILIESSYYVKKTKLDTLENNNVLLTRLRNCFEILLISCSVDNLDEVLKASTFRELLIGFDVGTDKCKFGPKPPDESMTISRLKELNFQSTRLIARTIRLGEVSKIKKKQYEKKNKDPMNYLQYKKTLEACSTLCALLNKSSTAFLMERKIVGYRLLEKRCEDIVDFSYIRKYVSSLSNIKKAIEKGNSEFRIIKKRVMNNDDNDGSKNNTDIDNIESDNDDDDLITYIDFNENDIENISPDEEKENINLEIERDDESDNSNETDVVRNNIIRKSCCAKGCNNNTTNKPETIWYNVPNPRCQEIKSHSNDKQRRKFTSTKFYREEYLKRLGLNSNEKRKKLVHCNDHKLFEEEHAITYKDINNKTNQLTKKFILPLNPKRKNTSTRKFLKTHKPIVYKKKRQTSKHERVSTCGKERESIIIKTCDFVGCNNNIRTMEEGCKFKRIPPLSTKNPIKETKNWRRLFCTVQSVYRHRVRLKCGIKFNDTRTCLRICNKHKMKIEERKVRWLPVNKTEHETIKVKMYLPNKIDDENELLLERERRKNNREFRNSIEEQRHKLNDVSNLNSQSTATSLGLIISAIHHLSQIGVPEQQKFDNTPFQFQYSGKDKYSKDRQNKDRDKRKTMFRLLDMTDKEIHHDTGFKSVSCLICFAIIVCKGNIEKLTTTTTLLTWFEEWLLYFTIVWGRACIRWYDVSRRFKICESTARNIFDVKQQMVLDIMYDWPRFVNYEEEKFLQRDKWNDMFDTTRVIMWDMTDIRITEPSLAESARLTWNQYYQKNCGKGGIYIQSSSWIGTHDLWMGSVSDSEYLSSSGILEEQMEFVRDDHPNENIPFTNITDKGFRVTAEAFRTGGQRVLQPPFMESDKQFTTEQTCETAAIATIRSANERAVNRIKQCRFVKKGLGTSENVERVSAVFLTFGFQCNFMFEPVQ